LKNEQSEEMIKMKETHASKLGEKEQELEQLKNSLETIRNTTVTLTSEL
jgi:hypothetical protein